MPFDAQSVHLCLNIITKTCMSQAPCLYVLFNMFAMVLYGSSMLLKMDWEMQRIWKKKTTSDYVCKIWPLRLINKNEFNVMNSYFVVTSLFLLLSVNVITVVEAHQHSSHMFPVSTFTYVSAVCVHVTWIVGKCLSLCKKASNHHANLPLEMYSFTL